MGGKEAYAAIFWLCEPQEKKKKKKKNSIPWTAQRRPGHARLSGTETGTYLENYIRKRFPFLPLPLRLIYVQARTCVFPFFISTGNRCETTVVLLLEFLGFVKYSGIIVKYKI